MIKQVQPKKSKFSSTLSLLKFNRKKKATDTQEHSVPIKGLISGMAMHYAKCCHPLPGDKNEMASKILVLPTAFLPLSNVCVFENAKVFFLKFL